MNANDNPLLYLKNLYTVKNYTISEVVYSIYESIRLNPTIQEGSKLRKLMDSETYICLQ